MFQSQFSPEISFCIFVCLPFVFSFFHRPQSCPPSQFSLRFPIPRLHSPLRSSSRTLPAPRSFAPRSTVIPRNPSQLLAHQFLRVPRLPTSLRFAMAIRSRSPLVIFFIKGLRATTNLCVGSVFWVSPAVHKYLQLVSRALTQTPE